MPRETLGTYGRDDASRASIIILVIIVLVVMVLVALAVGQPGAPTRQDAPAAGTEHARPPSIEHNHVTLVRPPAWVPADRLAAPTPGPR